MNFPAKRKKTIANGLTSTEAIKGSGAKAAIKIPKNMAVNASIANIPRKTIKFMKFGFRPVDQ